MICPICHNPVKDHDGEGHPFHPEPCPICEAERAPGERTEENGS